MGFGETDCVWVGCEGLTVLVRRWVVSVDAVVVAVSGDVDSVVVFASVAVDSVVSVATVSFSDVPVVGLPRKRKYNNLPLYSSTVTVYGITLNSPSSKIMSEKEIQIL